MKADGQRFDGFGIGGALRKENLGTIVGWVSQELSGDRARHLLGISEPDDSLTAVETGANAFDCVSPSCIARNAATCSSDGRLSLTRAQFRRDFNPFVPGCDCHTCTYYPHAHLHYLYKAKEVFLSTLATIHNEHFTVQLVGGIRTVIETGDHTDSKEETLDRFYAGK